MPRRASSPDTTTPASATKQASARVRPKGSHPKSKKGEPRPSRAKPPLPTLDSIAAEQTLSPAEAIDAAEAIPPCPVPAPLLDALTDRQRAFVVRYFANGYVASEAYRDAYAYTGPNARKVASECLGRPTVRAAVDAGRAALEATTADLSAALRRRLAAVAFADIRNVVTWADGRVELRNADEIDDDTAAAIESVKRIPTQFGDRLEIKLRDTAAAQRALGDHIPGFWAKQQVELSAHVTLAELLAAPPAPTSAPT